MKAVVLFIGAVVLVFSVALFPEITKESAKIAEAAAIQIAPLYSYVNELFIGGLYSATVPFFFALYQTFKLLGHIDRKRAFSQGSIDILKKIKCCAIAVCALYMAGIMPFVVCIAELDDAPGLVIIGLAIGLSPFVIATFAAILQKLLQEAIDIKEENDLTV